MTRLQIIRLRKSIPPSREDLRHRSKTKGGRFPEKGISQSELANRLAIPVSTVQAWERKSKPKKPCGENGDSLCRLAYIVRS